MQGARALAQGLGPLIFAGLFALFTQSWSPLPYFPGMQTPALSSLLFIRAWFPFRVSNMFR